MLTRLSSEQLSEAWPMVKIALESSSISLAFLSEERINEILRNLLSDRAACWIHGSGSTITTVIVTTIVTEPLSNTRNLLIYCAHGFSKLDGKRYLAAAEEIGRYAKNEGCAQVILYSENEKLSDIFLRNGAVGGARLITFPVA